jgi:hypothetical protein
MTTSGVPSCSKVRPPVVSRARRASTSVPLGWPAAPRRKIASTASEVNSARSVRSIASASIPRASQAPTQAPMLLPAT